MQNGLLVGLYAALWMKLTHYTAIQASVNFRLQQSEWVDF